MFLHQIETPNEDSLTECSKNQNKGRDLVESVKQLQRAGLQVQGGFIVGFDNDSPFIFQQQINFIQASGIVTAMVALLQAPSGTRLYARMQKEGRLVNEFSGDNVNGLTNIKSEEMDVQTGISILRRALEDPMRLIASNAGQEGAVVIDAVRRIARESSNINIGYNVMSGAYEDMLVSGIIDPAKVTRSAVENASSIAAMILTIDALITDVPQKNPTPAMPYGGGGEY